MNYDELKRPALPNNTILGDYQIEQEAGRGADFIIYRGLHRTNKSSYLIKEYFSRRLFRDAMIHRDITGAIRFTPLCTDAERLELSAQIETRRLYDLNTMRDCSRLDNVEGHLSTFYYSALQSKADICLKDYSFPMRDSAMSRILDKLSVFSCICREVDRIHQRGIVHCGLEPENIYISATDIREDTSVAIVDYQYSISDGRYDRSEIISRWNSYSSLYSGRELAMLREVTSDKQFYERAALLGAHTDVYSLLIILLQLLCDWENVPRIFSHYDLRNNQDVQALPEEAQLKLLDLFARGFGTVRTRKKLLPDTTALLQHINSLMYDIQKLLW